jgi:ATPase family protein associated with various cellular activities (AAA)
LNALADEIRDQLEGARNLYNRLVLVVGPAGCGKTKALRALCDANALPYVNLNLVLSQRLLEHTSKARPLRLRSALDDVLARAEGEVVVLDNIEVLFDPGLRQDPLRLLQLVSRNRTVVATWNGEVTGRTLTYAAAGHPEHRRYTDVDTILVRAGRKSDARAPEGDAR